MEYDSTRPLPVAPKRMDISKARAALRSDIAAAERYLEICQDGDRGKVAAKIEHLQRILRGTYL